MTGRRIPYKPEYAAVTRGAADLGATDREIADALGVSTRTLNRWASRHPEFSDALKKGRAAANARVERSLYHRAVGYSHEAVKLQLVGGEVVRTPFIQHHPPVVAAAIFWLKNRDPENWRDRQQHELSGPDGAPLPALQVTFAAGVWGRRRAG